MQNTFGVQLRSDDITTLGLFHAEQRQRLNVIREDTVLETSGAVYSQNEIQWTSWLRTLAGVRTVAVSHLQASATLWLVARPGFRVGIRR